MNGRKRCSLLKITEVIICPKFGVFVLFCIVSSNILHRLPLEMPSDGRN